MDPESRLKLLLLASFVLAIGGTTIIVLFLLLSAWRRGVLRDRRRAAERQDRVPEDEAPDAWSESGRRVEIAAADGDEDDEDDDDRRR